MNITEKLAALKARHRNRKRKLKTIGQLKAWLHARRGHLRHHACEARGTASKNTHRNIWNVRSSKGVRPEGRFMKLRAFKHQFGL